MSKKLCKGIRKDGSPCRGQGLKQYNGLCITHGPSPDQTFEWRSLGGKNSATAVRLDKRIPEDLKQAIDLVRDSMIQVKEGKMSPAACNAICRGAQTLIVLRRRTDEEMDDIRAEEVQAAAARYLDAHANLDVLEAADDMVARQDKFRREALVEQDFAEVKQPFNRDDPPEIVLNDKGRRRFGYRNLDMTQEFLDEVENDLTDFDPQNSRVPDIPETTDLLEALQEDVEESLSTLARDDVAPFDPLTGQAITKLPAGVKTSPRPIRYTLEDQNPMEVLKEQRKEIKKLKRKAEKLSEDKDYKRRLAEIEEHRKNLEETEAFLEANGHPIGPLPEKLSWQ